MSPDPKRYEGRLLSCVWELTLACCFSCKYCGSGAGKPRKNELTTEEALDIARQLSELGCRYVSLIGGEVFLRKDWKEIVSRLVAGGIRVCIITNGFIMTPELVGELRETGVSSVAVSLDSIGRVHDKYRQTGSFARAVDAIDSLTAAGIPTSVISTLNAENVEYLEALYKVLSNYNIFAWQLQACSPMGNAAGNGIDHRFDFEKVISFVRSKRETAGFAVGIADNIGYFTNDDALLRGDPSNLHPFDGCGAGIRSIGIDSIGNVRGCESMYSDEFIEGNLRDRSLRNIWEDPDAFAYNRRFDRSMLTGACADCPDGSRCRAGCRSYNRFTGGELYSSPYCVRKRR